MAEVKILNGAELAKTLKKRQAERVKLLKEGAAGAGAATTTRAANAGETKMGTSAARAGVTKMRTAGAGAAGAATAMGTSAARAGVTKMRTAEAGGRVPRLVILRDNDRPEIRKYVELKRRYGTEIGVEVVDQLIEKPVAKLRAATEEQMTKLRAEMRREQVAKLRAAVAENNANPETDGLIVQLPLEDPAQTEAVVAEIAAKKDLDNLSGRAGHDTATAAAIHRLLTEYGVPIERAKIAIVGQGRLVGKPLAERWRASGYRVTTFEKGDDLRRLRDFEVIVTATGQPRLIVNEMVSAGTTLVDAGTASEGGRLVGDIDDAVRERTDLAAITPKIGGVGPMTIAMLFEFLVRGGER